MRPVIADLPPMPGPLDPAADLAVALAQLLSRLHVEGGGAAGDAETVGAAAALASLATAAGHSCADLADAASIPTPPALGTAWPDTDVLHDVLRRSPVVAVEAGGSPEDLRPLVLSEARLYLRRYWGYERDLARRLAGLDAPRPGPSAEAVEQRLDRWFARDDVRTRAQRHAARIALTRSLCVVTGGPGTGKTTTVVRLLAALLDGDPGLKIALAAPTGKAAARMDEAIRRQIASLPDLPAPTRARLEAGGAQTLHRLLGHRPGSVQFRHGEDHPLPYDVVVADEASMLDLALAAKLLAAVRPGARLVLLGDKDQLASVEAGSVFAQICSPQSRRDAAVVRLTHSFRFESGGGIGTLARIVNEGDAAQARTTLAAGTDPGLAWEPAVPAAPVLAPRLMDGYADFVAAVRGGAAPAAVLAALDRYRVLCALRGGPQGAVALNAAMAEAFLEATGHAGAVPRWFAGRPVMVTANDYVLKLFNGDVGVALPTGEGGALAVHFPDAEGGTRAIASVRVPACETAFAMTIHKAQGSEFERADIVLPSKETPLITRELVYTALTRARSSLRLWSTAAILAGGIERRIVRHSGLADRLAKEG